MRCVARSSVRGICLGLLVGITLLVRARLFRLKTKPAKPRARHVLTMGARTRRNESIIALSPGRHGGCTCYRPLLLTPSIVTGKSKQPIILLLVCMYL